MSTPTEPLEPNEPAPDPIPDQPAEPEPVQ
jgi:hypothetical protein